MKKFISKVGERGFICQYCKEDVQKKFGREYMFCENMWGHIETKWYEANTPEQGILGTVSLHRNIPCIHRAHTVLYRSLTVHSPCTHRASPFIYRAR